MTPWEQDELIVSCFVFLFVVIMVFTVYKDLIKPSGMSKFGMLLICGVLLTAPFAFMAKNIVILLSAFRI